MVEEIKHKSIDKSAILSSHLISDAKKYAIQCHTETNHLYDDKPYEYHLRMVVDFGYKYIDLLPNEEIAVYVLASCWTHDVIEDCRQTYNNVKAICGLFVAEITYALTNEKGKNRKERANDKYYDVIRKTQYASFVKICDRLANMRYSKEIGGGMLNAYIKEHDEFKKQLYFPAYQPMFDELTEYI